MHNGKKCQLKILQKLIIIKSRKYFFSDPKHFLTPSVKNWNILRII